jgi:hypothetical protein
VGLGPLLLTLLCKPALIGAADQTDPPVALLCTEGAMEKNPPTHRAVHLYIWQTISPPGSFPLDCLVSEYWSTVWIFSRQCAVNSAQATQ